MVGFDLLIDYIDEQERYKIACAIIWAQEAYENSWSEITARYSSSFKDVANLAVNEYQLRRGWEGVLVSLLDDHWNESRDWAKNILDIEICPCCGSSISKQKFNNIVNR